MNTLEAKALYFLSRRDYAYHELFNKLKKYSADEAMIQQLLNKMQQKGWLSEERYVESYLNSRTKKYGLLKVKQELLYKTGNSQLVEQVLKSAAVDEYKVAHSLWEKKFGTRATDPKERARQARFLRNKGFSFTTIKQILDICIAED